MRNSLGKYIAVIAIAILLASNIIIFMSILHDKIYGYYSISILDILDLIMMFMVIISGILWYTFIYFGYFEGKQIRKRYKAIMLLSLMFYYISSFGYAVFQNIVNLNIYAKHSIIGIFGSTSDFIVAIILLIMLIMLLINKLSMKSMTVLVIVAAIFYVFFGMAYQFLLNPGYLVQWITYTLWILSFIPISLLLVALFFQSQSKLKVFLIIEFGFLIILKSVNFIVYSGSHSSLMVVTNTFIITGFILLLIATILFKENKESDNEK